MQMSILRWLSNQTIVIKDEAQFYGFKYLIKQLSQKMKTSFTYSSVRKTNFVLSFMAILLLMSRGVMTIKFLLMKLRNNTAIGHTFPGGSFLKNGGYRRIEKKSGNVTLTRIVQTSQPKLELVSLLQTKLYITVLRCKR